MRKIPILKRVYQAIPFKKVVFQVIRSVYTPPEKIYIHLFFDGKFKVKINETHYFYMNQYNTHGYRIEDDMFWLGLQKNSREKLSISLWLQLAQQSQVIFDIGANTGIFTLLAKGINPNCHVFGFEPIQRTFEKYKNNCLINQYEQVHCEQIALSNQTGTADIYDLPVENLYSATLNQKFSDTHHDLAEQIAISVKTETLSDYIERQGIARIDLMKIDVEMHEPEVLEGMKHYLKQFQPTLLIEILTTDIGLKIQALLEGMDYLFFNLDETTQPKQVASISKSDSYNYLICNERIAIDLGLIGA
jgi:FkbM family methyltransferase